LDSALQRIRSIADYQFGKGVGVRLFPEDIDIAYSKTTGRIRYVSLNGERLATLRPTDGLLSLSVSAATYIAKNAGFARCFVTVRKDVSEFADDAVRAKDEVIVVDEDNRVLAVGRALLSSMEMKAFKTGVAVKVRHGCAKES
jgi:predicted RNA-binding protein (TIGR00451 family)